MIVHFAAFTWRHGVTTDQVKGLTCALNAMASQIPVVVRYTCGPALRLRDGIADFGVIAVLAHPSDLEEYLGHPLHDEVQAAWLADMVADRRAVQLPLPPDFLGG